MQYNAHSIKIQDSAKGIRLSVLATCCSETRRKPKKEDSNRNQWKRLKNLIKTKRIYDPKEDSDGTRILITRKWPRGQKKDRFDEWIRDLSPEEDTLNKLDDSKKTEEGWKRYRVKYFHKSKEVKLLIKLKSCIIDQRTGKL